MNHPGRIGTTWRKEISPWSHWIKSSTGLISLLHAPCVSCPLVWVRTVDCLEKAVIWWLCPCVCPGVAVWRCLSLIEVLVFSFTEQHRKCDMRMEWGTLQNSFTVLQGVKSLFPTDPDNKHHCLSTNTHKRCIQPLWWILGSYFQPLY